MNDGTFSCPTDGRFIQAANGLLLLAFTRDNEVFMQAQDGDQWSRITAQTPLARFTDPVTFRQRYGIVDLERAVVRRAGAERPRALREVGFADEVHDAARAAHAHLEARVGAIGLGLAALSHIAGQSLVARPSGPFLGSGLSDSQPSPMVHQAIVTREAFNSVQFAEDIATGLVAWVQGEAEAGPTS